VQTCYEISFSCEYSTTLSYERVVLTVSANLQDLDITMTVGGYASITRDVYRNKKALRYNESGVYPRGEHARL